jgi:hypothetical protein
MPTFAKAKVDDVLAKKSHRNATKTFIRLVLHWRVLCMGLKRIPQPNVGNVRCTGTEPDKQPRLRQMLIVSRE